MITIRLQKNEWQYDDTEPLGPEGGFGEVFRGEGRDGDVAVKRLKLSAGNAAHRELKISKALFDQSLKHVVPILDAGQDAESDRYYIVMPICEMSLTQYMAQHGDTLGVDLAAQVLTEIADGLIEVPMLIHRDIKPSNVLLHSSNWKIADFGIAKFVEESTSLETLKHFLTPEYAAPEQWRLDSVSSATDVYALGCVAYSIVSGAPPFRGETYDALSQLHLYTTPPALEGVPPRFSGLISMMLRKDPASRPSTARCREVLSQIAQAEDGPRKRAQGLETAALAVAQRRAEEEAEQTRLERLQAEKERRFSEASESLDNIRDHLYEQTIDMTLGQADRSGDALHFGHCRFEITKPIDNYIGIGGRSRYEILAEAKIRVEQGIKYNFGAELIFARDKDGGDGFRWLEIGFAAPWGPPPNGLEAPFWLPGGVNDIDAAFAPGGRRFSPAYSPFIIDGEEEHDFIARWQAVLALAAEGKMAPPRQTPIERWPIHQSW